MDIRLPGGNTLGVQTYRRNPASRYWLTMGPVYDSTDVTLGAAIAVGSRGLAVYVMPALYSMISCGEDE